MMDFIAGVLFMILGTVFTIWPRTLWWLRRGWLSDREPTRADLLFSRLSGVIVGVMGFALIWQSS